MEHYFMHTMSHDHHDGHEMGKWESSSFESSEICPSSGFDCNICLDLVQEPVVTLCGHLYCWPCIYKWINLESLSTELSEKQAPKCPVCKSEVTETTLVPLYGRGSSLKHFDEKMPESPIPLRPKGPSGMAHQMLVAATNSSLQPPPQDGGGVHRTGRGDVPPYPPYYDEYSSESHQAISFAGSSTFHPVINMFGDLICARLFSSNSQQPLYSNPNSYANPSSYSVAVTGSARGRRQLVQADQSLSRLSLFFCCCLVLCLLLF